MGLTTTVRDIIAELNRQAAEHQVNRLLLIKRISADPTYQREVKRIQQSHGRQVFHYAPDGWRVVLEPSSDADSPHFSPAVNALMNEVHMNEASLSCIRAKIEALTTFLVPVFRLPPEVLVLIFKAGARMPQDGPVTESTVPRPFPARDRLGVPTMARYRDQHPRTLDEHHHPAPSTLQLDSC
ncbi:hypothetical protein NUW54_g14589 [Trametes sanguinea]|uniref:Uncharacterized protein n=1 Tax=Trametes sanguinea TaxID=158606 RepID=A0ACC1MBT9_9APHY|nr:hypothetical protein NUW54_g14589 [Trametes sanguinea]